jgi:LEA14-like dessication related protein
MKPKLNRPTRCAIIGAAVMIVLSGCATTPTLEAPSVTVSDIKTAGMTLFETTLEVELRVSNPNPESLPVEGASFRLFLDGKKIGTGMSSEVVEVPRLDSVVLHAKFFINNASALMRVRQILEQKDVNYEVRGRLFVTRPSGTKTLKVQNSGHLDLEAPIGQPPPKANSLPSLDEIGG